MDVFNRLKTAVTNVLPVGNPITGEFEVLSQRASGGPAMLWKIFDGVQRSTKQEASVFLFEKKLLERFSKRDREIILEVLKRGVSQLTKLRHPKILSVLHPLEDCRESLAFATERVLCSLANVLGQHDNLPQPAPASLKDYQLYDVEIKYGLLQVIEGLGFLHNSVYMVHSSLSPESIFINSFGCWKLAGFDFCINNANQQSQSPYFPVREWDPHLTPVAQPKLNYMAPEFALMSSCDRASDMFAVGVLIHALYNGGQPVFDSIGDWSKFQRNSEKLKTFKESQLLNIPSEVKEHVKMLLNVEPSLRPDADQLAKVPFFEDFGVITLQYLDLLVQKDNLQKSQFFKGLSKVINKLPMRVNMQRVLPSLCRECINPNMVPFVLPNMMLIAEQASDVEFSKQIFPAFIPLFRITDPLQVMLIFLQNMNLLLSKTPSADIRNHVLPMIARALDSDQQQIQELCLGIIPTFAGLVEYSSLKNSLVPRICKLCLSTATLSVRVNCLVCLGKSLEHLDRWFVLDEVLPMLPQIPSREPAVLMSMLGIYQVTLTHKKLGITKEMLATKVIPFLFPLCIDSGLNLGQFNAFINILKDMFSRVESDQRTKLEQLNSVQQEQKTLQQFAQDAMQSDSVTAADKGTSDETMMGSFMSELGFGGFASTSGPKKVKSGGANSSVTLLDGNLPAASSASQSHPTSQPSSALSLEEKARLARQQDLQRQFKSQPALQAQPAVDSVSKSSVRDLSSTLLSSSMTPIQSDSRHTSPSGSRQLTSSAVTWNSTTNLSSNSHQPLANPAGTSKPAVDMSALDNILPATGKSRPTLSQMTTSPARGPPLHNPFASPAFMPQFSGPSVRNSVMPAAFQNSAAMGAMPGIVGMPAGGVGHINVTTSNNWVGSMYTGMQGIRPDVSQQTKQTGMQPLSNQDIADLLG